MECDSRSRGRPRDPRTDHAILEATLRLLAGEGFRGMTLDDVASLSGVSKPTIYRRWPTKLDLTVAAIAHLHSDCEVRRTGETQADLVAELLDLRATYESLRGMAMVGALLAEEQSHPQLMATWRREVVAARRARMTGIVSESIARGELRASVDAAIVVRLLVGYYYAHYIAGDRFPRSWAADAVAHVWAGVAEIRA